MITRLRAQRWNARRFAWGGIDCVEVRGRVAAAGRVVEPSGPACQQVGPGATRSTVASGPPRSSVPTGADRQGRRGRCLWTTRQRDSRQQQAPAGTGELRGEQRELRRGAASFGRERQASDHRRDRTDSARNNERQQTAKRATTGETERTAPGTANIDRPQSLGGSAWGPPAGAFEQVSVVEQDQPWPPAPRNPAYRGG
jgi:hypothetical protein